MPLILAGAAVLVVVVFLVLRKSGSESADQGGDQQTNESTRPATTPQTSSSTPPASSGKTPDRPAPELTADTVAKVMVLMREAKSLNNEGVVARNAGENMVARSKQSEAKKKIDQLKLLIEKQSEWQEEAEMEEWAQPGSYVKLTKIWGDIALLQKRIRMAGGR